MIPQHSRNSTQDFMQELKSFINGTKKKSRSNPLELTKIALGLLKNLPAARDAVLDFFCINFDTAAQNYIVRIEVNGCNLITFHHLQLQYDFRQK